MPEDGFKMPLAFGTATFVIWHRFLIAVAGTVVNNDGKGGSAPDPLVWSSGALTIKARSDPSARDLACLPGPAHHLSGWCWGLAVLCQVAG